MILQKEELTLKNIRIPNDRYRAECEAKGYCEFAIIQVRRWVETYLR